MKFVKIEDIVEGVAPLRDRLEHDLSDNKQVLWLMTGGSNIPLSVSVMAQLPDTLTSRLTILLTDERFGAVGHANSNMEQLKRAGFMPKQAMVMSVLKPDLSLEETCRGYGIHFQAAVRKADVVLGQFGMGADGHIAGILPGSPAVSSGDLTAAYDAPPYTRVTLTPKALQQLSVAYLFAFGADKRGALENLQGKTLSLDEQPAQILRQIPEACIYNDQIE
jgi:6-phosphogluconolactonase/glucosamine-6-phosphate isomerase/deaminase